MTGKILKEHLRTHNFTYEGFAAAINEYCQREIISPKRAKQTVGDWVNERTGMHPAVDFITDQFFAKQHQ